MKNHEIQNEIKEISAGLIQETLANDVNEASYFSIMADETMDITAIEQLSFSCRYISIHEDHSVVREDFLGFIPIYHPTGESIAKTILQQCEKLGLDMNKCVGQGYYEASSMTSHEKCVQARIRRDYPKVLLVCQHKV
ncbi:hypothetical protein NQ314_001847 [Rhamnusium bicolor]|uniref:DUF4371 domain-containing protein n=1 Tax=Rhamnusium bicolor TaxID=1586634 RepID=A0AAV8ZSE4_9CUCU|nr:hypothetical protein NQ314_001847 [Rhamnusium bicolor]